MAILTDVFEWKKRAGRLPVVLSLSLALALSVAPFSAEKAAARVSSKANVTSAAPVPMFNPDLIADVAEGLAPSVVNIEVEKSVQAMPQGIPGPQGFFGFPLNDDIMRRFFGWDSGSAPFKPFGPPDAAPSNPPQQAPEQRVMTGNGSGMIISPDGYILTNNHVVATADKVMATLNDGRRLPARLVGRDRFSDIAVLKIDASGLKPVAFGDSDKLRAGEWVIAVGSPMGFDHTVTQGIISGLSRKIPDLNTNISFIQTDAAVNPGNSGGPLANLKGEVIGVNTAILGRGQNIGFAIPINAVKTIADTLIAGKPVTRPWIGISMVPLNPDLARHVGLPPNTEGVVIAQVLQDSPAYKAGLMQGDVIQKVDGKAVVKAEAIQEVVRSRPPHSKISLEILRNGHPVEVGLVSEQLPDSDTAPEPVRPQVHPPLH